MALIRNSSMNTADASPCRQRRQPFQQIQGELVVAWPLARQVAMQGDQSVHSRSVVLHGCQRNPAIDIDAHWPQA
jgi:hypothetical protein